MFFLFTTHALDSIYSLKNDTYFNFGQKQHNDNNSR